MSSKATRHVIKVETRDKNPAYKDKNIKTRKHNDCHGQHKNKHRLKCLTKHPKIHTRTNNVTTLFTGMVKPAGIELFQVIESMLLQDARHGVLEALSAQVLESLWKLVIHFGGMIMK